MPSNRDHDRNLKSAFDAQAEQFERAPVQTDPRALEYLVAVADLPAKSRILDAGCGPGLVSEAFLKAGHTLFGVDLSCEMIARAERRCAPFGDRARFVESSVFDPTLNARGTQGDRSNQAPRRPLGARVSARASQRRLDPNSRASRDRAGSQDLRRAGAC